MFGNRDKPATMRARRDAFKKIVDPIIGVSCFLALSFDFFMTISKLFLFRSVNRKPFIILL